MFYKDQIISRKYERLNNFIEYRMDERKKEAEKIERRRVRRAKRKSKHSF